MNYSHTFAASSPTVSRSSSQPSPNVRVPRYLRRYTIAAQHRPTSPLANSFVPDEYYYSRKAQEHDTATSCSHPSFSSAHQFSPSPWDRRRSEPIIVNPGPKVHQCRYTTTPSPSPSSVFAPVHSPRAQSLSADVLPLTQHPHDPRPRSSIFIHSQLSVSSFSTECSFHTAVDDAEFNKILSDDSLIHEPRPRSWDELPLSIKPEWSDSSNSGSRSSAFGFTSRGRQSSADTVVSPADDSGGINPEKEGKPEYDDDEWPVTYLTTVTRQELDEYEKENKTQQRPRKFTWGRREGRKFTDKGTEATSDMLAEGNRRKSRKLKKKRPESLQTEGVHPLDQTFDSCIISIYTEGEQEEFDPLRDLPIQAAEAIPLELDETIDEAQIGIAISSDDREIGIPFNEPIPNGQDDEWEDMESADQHGYRCRQERMPSEDDRDLWLDDAILERIRSRTPQEILQGLDVVHEEEEEDSASEVKAEDVTDAFKGTPGDLAKRGSYPYIKNKGKERQEETHPETIEEENLLVGVIQQEADTDVDELAAATAPCEENITLPTLKQTPSSGTRRRKLSKRRRSRRNLDADSSPPPLPELTAYGTGGKGGKRDTRRRPVPTSKKPSIPTLRPRQTPKTIMSTLRCHVFRPFALLLGIDVANGRRRLSRELRTPNALLAGRHFSEKHIPRFPSRLDGLRTVDKKVAKYD